jgi:predicted XRE-type DNA-binding protein
MKPKQTTRKKNPRLGSSFNDFLQADGTYDEVTSAAIKRSLALQVQREMERQAITKVEMARRMETSRSQLNRLLDPENDKIQLDTLYKAATALGKSLSLELR